MENETGDFFRGKKILITGGAGSIGSEILRALLIYEPKSVRVLDQNESRQFELKNELKSHRNISFLIGDIRDRNRVIMTIEDIDIVFHAAALKHVPLCEYNPFEATKTNVIGTQNVIDAALHEEVEKMITISTDKAVNPINVMGATKLLAERLTIAANYYKGNRKTAFSCVRFGNVLDSSGSIIPLLKKQIEQGGPVTITDHRMKRFVMNIPKAIELVLRATKKTRGGEIFIFKMPLMHIKDLAELMIEELAPKHGYKPDDIKTEIIGIRPGEKISEELVTKEECCHMEEENEMFKIDSMINLFGKPNKTAKFGNEKYCDVEGGRLLSKAEIKKLLIESNIL